MKNKLTVEPTEVIIPEGKPTESGLLKEASTLGTSFAPISAGVGDVIADAHEMKSARGDVNELKRRGYYVTEHHFDRLELLIEMLVPLGARQKKAIEARRRKTLAGEEARAKLLVNRERLARIGVAGGLPASLFQMTTRSTSRLNTVMNEVDEVLQLIEEHRASLPDQDTVDDLVAESRQLIEENRQSRLAGKIIGGDRSITTITTGQLCRLLVNVMQHLSKQGLAAFPDDPTRETAYRLDNIYRRNRKKAGDDVTPTEPPVDG